MHELSIAMAMVDQVQRAAAAHGHEAASSVSLHLGELAGVVPDALHFCFSLAAEGTVLAGAELRIESLPGRARCGSCAGEWATGVPPFLVCPECGGSAAGLVSGREMQITEVRWAVPDGPARSAPTHEKSWES
jgi:hydrogenase nickel incorporation protein HypA/HybF